MKGLKFYLLKRNEGDHIYYDEAAGFVVAATSPLHARQIAADSAGDEGEGTWLDEQRSTCEQLQPSQFPSPGVVLRDFHAG